jgi:membrane-bound ClpP family serine protease
LALVFAVPTALRAQEATAEDGIFITVNDPITSGVMNRVMEMTERARRRPDRRIRKIIYDFNPGNHPCGTKAYGPCYDLAKYLLTVQDVTTVAFVHNEVSRHTVLPVLACHELVMSAESKIGDVMRDQTEPFTEDQRQFYERVAQDRRRSPAVVLKMIDKNMEVLEGTTARGSVHYLDKRRQAQEAKAGVIVKSLKPVLPAGDPGLYRAAEAMKFGLCQLIKESRQEVAEFYRLPPASLREDPLQGSTPNAYHFVVKGSVNRALAESLQRSLRKAVGRKANLLFLELDCRGGDTVVARDLAEFLRTLTDDEGRLPVMTVAYIPAGAPDTATFVALGCTEIVMGTNAVLGDFDSIVHTRQGGHAREVNPEEYRAKRESLVGLAQEQGYPPLVFRGMLDKGLTIYQAHTQKGQFERRLLSAEELSQDEAGERKWVKGDQIKAGGPQGQFLKLNASLAEQLGIARHKVQTLREVYQKYGIDDAGSVREARADWLDELATALCHPLLSLCLVMVGIGALVLELKMPGVGLPGVIAALCFVLFFWSHSQLAGEILWLAVLLFLLGLLLIGLEIFVLPGFGVIGISGTVLLVVSLGLVTLEKKPETTQEWLSFGSTLSTFGLGLVVAVMATLVLARFLPQIPYANRLVLAPPVEREELVSDSASAVPAAAVALLGAIGVAVTPLRPAGMARFGDDFLDVVAEGSFVAPGSRVQVIEVEGNRIVVKEV